MSRKGAVVFGAAVLLIVLALAGCDSRGENEEDYSNNNVERYKNHNNL